MQVNAVAKAQGVHAVPMLGVALAWRSRLQDQPCAAPLVRICCDLRLVIPKAGHQFIQSGAAVGLPAARPAACGGLWTIQSSLLLLFPGSVYPPVRNLNSMAGCLPGTPGCRTRLVRIEMRQS